MTLSNFQNHPSPSPPRPYSVASLPLLCIFARADKVKAEVWNGVVPCSRPPNPYFWHLQNKGWSRSTSLQHAPVLQSVSSMCSVALPRGSAWNCYQTLVDPCIGEIGGQGQAVSCLLTNNDFSVLQEVAWVELSELQALAQQTREASCGSPLDAAFRFDLFGPGLRHPPPPHLDTQESPTAGHEAPRGALHLAERGREDNVLVLACAPPWPAQHSPCDHSIFLPPFAFVVCGCFSFFLFVKQGTHCICVA